MYGREKEFLLKFLCSMIKKIMSENVAALLYEYVEDWKYGKNN